MTRPSASALVLDGSEVKLRLVAERASSGSAVHVDWVRFTAIRRNAPFVSPDLLFPTSLDSSYWDHDHGAIRVLRVLRDLPDPDFAASAQALELAQEVARLLGPAFTVPLEVRKGHDFYRHRWSIERNGAECGWVGFLASGDSPRQQAQARTVHANLYGAACTFADAGWTERIADLIDRLDADVTRCDLALDFFDGLAGGMERVLSDYRGGLCDVGGKKLTSNMAGDWANGHARSFYFGSKEAGKQTNVYEKGDQLFGVDEGCKWIRAELRYGNKLRVLPSDMLRRPSDVFAGASDYHAALLREAQASAVPEPVRCHGRLAQETVEAEVTRNVRWALSTAAPTIAAAFLHMGEGFLELVTNQKLPGRLRKFSPSELSRAFAAVVDGFTVGSAGPAFASP
jgi:phage replication initiation protein